MSRSPGKSRAAVIWEYSKKGEESCTGIKYKKNFVMQISAPYYLGTTVAVLTRFSLLPPTSCNSLPY